MAEPTLEGLPVELQIAILFEIPDLASLRSLVFASPVYYQAYQLVRVGVLHAVIQASYDGLVDITDAVAAVRSRGLYAYDVSNREDIIALLDGRRRSEEIRQLNLLSTRVLPDRPATVDEALELIHLHKRATFLLDDYTRTAMCPPWMEASKWKGEVLPLTLSTTEKRRFLRAFYRLQIYGNIFGCIEIPLGAEAPEKENDWDRGKGTFSNEEAWRLFFGTMAPWEVEEFGCMWEHCCCRWTGPFYEMIDSLGGVDFWDERPAREQPPVTRRFSDPPELRGLEMEHRDCLVSMGPSILVRVLREQDFLTRQNLIIANAKGFIKIFEDFWPCPESRDPGALPLLYPADKFNVGADIDRLNQILSSLPPHEQPNLAWTQRWTGDVCCYREAFLDMFNYAIRHPRWEWGYAFWDDERLIEWRAPSAD